MHKTKHYFFSNQPTEPSLDNNMMIKVIMWLMKRVISLLGGERVQEIGWAGPR